MPFTRRHIVQFKPEGVANLFAPTIRINGQTIQVDETHSPAASNGVDSSYVNYPSTRTVSSDRVQVSQQDMLSSNFNQLFHRMFSNLLETDSESSSQAGPSPSSTGQSSAYGLGQNSFESNFAQYFSSSLASQLNCLNNGGLCRPSEECPPGRNLGSCSQEGLVCCQDDSTPDASNSNASFFNTGSGYAGTVTGDGSATGTNPEDQVGIYVDIKYNSVNFSQLTFTDKETLKKNTLDRFLNQSQAENIEISKDDVIQVQIFSGSVVVRLMFKNNADLRYKIKILVDKIRTNLSVLNIYFKQERIQTANIMSTTDRLPASSSSMTSTSPEGGSANTQNNTGTGGGSTNLPSEFGVEKTFCQQFCNRELKDTKVNEEGYIVPSESYYAWRPCSTACKMNNCANCPGANYIDPNNTAKLLSEKYIREEDSSTPQTNFITGYPKEPAREDTNKCFQKSEDECHQSKDCFYCISDENKNTKNCTMIQANGDYVCDSRFASGCVPIYNQGANLKTYNEDPFHNPENYTFIEQKLPEIGKKKVLEYPFQGKCIPPVKKQIDMEDRRKLLYQRYRR